MMKGRLELFQKFIRFGIALRPLLKCGLIVQLSNSEVPTRTSAVAAEERTQKSQSKAQQFAPSSTPPPSPGIVWSHY